MKNNKKTILMTTMLLALILLGIGTIAYFRRTVNGDITGNAGNLVLIVNEANAVENESFEVILQRSEEEPFIMPDDKGIFNLNIVSTGSTTDVAISIAISRVNLPNNLKFYSDEKHTNEITNYGTVIKKSADMTKTIPVYWFWDGSVSDEDDSEFINKEISANISVSATIAKTLYDTLMSYDKTIDANINFGQGASVNNGQGLMMLNGTQNDEYPVLYYRGNINNNNILFAGYCWLIVRTTETGGTKIIYNGEVNEDGSCINYSGVGGKIADTNYTNVYVENSLIKFNIGNNSPVHVGYMYNDDVFFSLSLANGRTDYKEFLEDNTIDLETGRHVQNLYDSNAKTIIDAWYKAKFEGTTEENLLEDTVWCNDRSLISNTHSLENYIDTYSWLLFGSGTRLVEPMLDTSFYISPSLTCNRKMDEFTVSSENGNGDLTYPIGMLTADEIVLAGNVYVEGVDLVITYLTLPNHYFWTLSPYGYIYRANGANMIIVAAGAHANNSVVNDAGIRPSISLNNGTYILSGNGSFENPYVVG